jgi:tRNA-specific 2-thiouridylase
VDSPIIQSMNQHVFVAMSGGVDSAVTAYLLKEAGYRVSAVHLELTPPAQNSQPLDHADLEEVCRKLEIPLHYLHLEDEFQEQVIDYFCREYAQGLTPNPCVRCNRRIKFGLLLKNVLEMGADYLATGHYAGVEKRENGFHLVKGVDSSKDQSYFLYVLEQSVLSRLILPLERMRKSEVKDLAARKGLPQATHKESQDICFVANNDHKSFLAARIDSPPGEIVGRNGRRMGQHQGLAYYTIGQRQGMGVSATERLYVIEKDAAHNRLVVGGWDDLLKNGLTAGAINWISGQPPSGPQTVKVKVRYRATEAPAVVEARGDQVEVRFITPQRGIAPGQSVVFYEGEEVLGGGIIEEAG